MRSKIWDYQKNQSCEINVGLQKNKEAQELLWAAVRGGAIDLHTHSNVSDGKSSPPQLIQEVIAHGLKTFALTDHDTVMGIEAISMVYEKLSQMGVDLPDFIPGVEISCDLEDQEVHLLAYYPAGMIRCLDGYLQERQKDRESRNMLLCQKVQEQGLKITYDELRSEGGFVVGRIHMAQLMIRKGYVASVQEAFDTYLSEGKPCYVKRELPAVKDAIEQIIHTGGVPVLAHPAIYHNWLQGEKVIPHADLVQKFRKLKDWGLQGVEVVHGETGLDQSRVIAAIGAQMNLIPTVGSDYHGSHKPRVLLRKADDPYLTLLADYYPIQKR